MSDSVFCVCWQRKQVTSPCIANFFESFFLVLYFTIYLFIWTLLYSDSTQWEVVIDFFLTSLKVWLLLLSFFPLFFKMKKKTLKNARLFFSSEKGEKNTSIPIPLPVLTVTFIHPFLQPITISSLIDSRIELLWTSILSWSILRSMCKTYAKVPVNRFLKKV